MENSIRNARAIKLKREELASACLVHKRKAKRLGVPIVFGIFAPTILIAMKNFAPEGSVFLKSDLFDTISFMLLVFFMGVSLLLYINQRKHETLVLSESLKVKYLDEAVEILDSSKGQENLYINLDEMLLEYGRVKESFLNKLNATIFRKDFHGRFNKLKTRIQVFSWIVSKSDDINGKE